MVPVRPGEVRREGWAGFGRAWSVPGELGYRFPGAGIVEKVLAAGGGGDERGGGGVVERPREPVGDAVQTGDGIVGEQWFLSSRQRQWWRR
jgi:hypothetical protein